MASKIVWREPSETRRKSQLSGGRCDASRVAPIGGKPWAVAIWLNWQWNKNQTGPLRNGKIRFLFINFQVFLEGFLPFLRHFPWAPPQIDDVNCISWLSRSVLKVRQQSLFAGCVSRCTGASLQFSTAEGDLLAWPAAMCGDAHLNPRVTEHQMGQSPRVLSSPLQARDTGKSTQADMTRTQRRNVRPDPSAVFEPGLSSSAVRPAFIATGGGMFGTKVQK